MRFILGASYLLCTVAEMPIGVPVLGTVRVSLSPGGLRRNQPDRDKKHLLNLGSPHGSSALPLAAAGHSVFLVKRRKTIIFSFIFLFLASARTSDPTPVLPYRILEISWRITAGLQTGRK